MEIIYERWNGAGNLLNIIDNRDGRYAAFFADQEQRRLLVVKSGGNGFMEIQSPPEGSPYSYEVVFHAGLGISGAAVPFCGNGSRCTAAYACQYGIVPPEKMAHFEFLAGDGVHWASVVEDSVHPGKYDVTMSMADIEDAKAVEGNQDEWFANSAQFVKFVEKGTLDSIEVMKEGPHLAIEKNYLGGGLMVIVNFVEERDDGVHARCYDTSNEVEILACGTACMAIAVVHAARRREPDGKRRKSIKWRNDAIDVGYTKRGAAFYDNSLRSLVFMEVKGSFKSD